MTLSFTVLGVAAPQGSLRAFVSKRTGRAFVTQANKRTMPWRQEVAARALQAPRVAGEEWPTREAVALWAVFYLPRPNGHYGKKGLRPSAPKYPAKKPDLSKLVRAAEDALSGIAYDDDARIVRHRIEKLYCDDFRPPRAEFSIEVLT